MSNQFNINTSTGKRWVEPETYPIPDNFQSAIGGNPLIAQMLYRLGIKDISAAQEFLDENFYHPASPNELPDLEKSIELLWEAINHKKKISIWGDFDVDGQTSTTLLFSTLRELGANVNYHIPIRAIESHGVNLPNLETLIDQGTQLLITCDTGISATSEVDYAQKRGVPVIITDHHDLPPKLPNAFGVVNPKLLSTDHPLSSLPGVGVAYQLMVQLCNHHGRPELSQEGLDLVALGIVADLAVIRNDTRWLLQNGLKALRQTNRIGLQILYEMSEINPGIITEEHISFFLAPRLNALGRLADANRAVEFLSTTDLGKAKIMAIELEGINAQRKLMTDQVFQAAQNQLQNNLRQLDDGLIILANPTWPAGVIGIVASRLVDRYNLPTILLSTPPGQIARGSARSVDGINISDLIAANKDLLVSCGGHPMAAGLSIESDKIPEFHRSILRSLHQTGGTPKTIAKLYVNGYLPLSDLSLDLVDQIERLSPFGPGNPAPLLATRHLKLAGYTSIGRSAEHLLLTIEDESGFVQKVIWWQGAGWTIPTGKFDLAYTVRAATYRGQRDIQVEWIDYRLCDEQPLQLETPPQTIHIFDYRQETDPMSVLQPLFEEGPIQVWCEAYSAQPFSCINRHQLSAACTTLAIWTIPPGPVELRTVIEKTKPEKVYLFGNNPNLDQPEAFLKRLAGLIKYAMIHNDGVVKLSELATASSHRIHTIRAGVKWLESHGYVAVREQDGDKLVIQYGSNLPSENAQITAQQLKALLDETNAFRIYYSTSDPNSLINL